MRYFILKSNTSCLENINPKAPASSGRFDVVLDFIIEAFITREGIRKDIIVYVILDGCKPCKVIEVRPDYLSNIKISTENSLVKLFLEKKLPVYEMCLRELIEYLKSQGIRIYYLHEEGRFIKDAEIENDDVAFIIGDQDGLTIDDEKIIDSFNIPRISLGKLPYLSWFCISIVNYYLDSR